MVSLNQSKFFLFLCGRVVVLFCLSIIFVAVLFFLIMVSQ